MNTNRFRLLTLAAALLASPAVHAQFSQPVRDVENAAQNLFVSSDNSTTPVSQNLILDVAPLPAGKRLAIEALSLRCSLADVSGIRDAYISVWHKKPSEQFPQALPFSIHMVKQGVVGGRANWVGSLNGRVFNDYVGPNVVAKIQVWRSINGASDTEFRCEYSLHGGLTNLPLQ